MNVSMPALLVLLLENLAFTITLCFSLLGLICDPGPHYCFINVTNSCYTFFTFEIENCLLLSGHP